MTAALLRPPELLSPEPGIRDERIAALRRRLAAVPGKGAGARIPEVARPVSVLAVPQALAELLPRGGLARGTVVSVSGASSLLLGLLASVTGEGGWAAVVGCPRLGLLAAAEMGADLRRVALVPHPGSDPVDVAAVLLDGLDLVVLHLAGAVVGPARARGVGARARHRGGVLVVTGGSWPGAELELRAEVSGCTGLGPGHGRVRSRELTVAVRGRGQAVRGRSARVLLCPEGSAVHWSPGRTEAQPVAR